MRGASRVQLCTSPTRTPLLVHPGAAEHNPSEAPVGVTGAAPSPQLPWTLVSPHHQLQVVIRSHLALSVSLKPPRESVSSAHVTGEENQGTEGLKNVLQGQSLDSDSESLAPESVLETITQCHFPGPDENVSLDGRE